MRYLLLLLVSCSLSPTIAQAPERMSFQAVVRDASDDLVINAPVGMRISILQGGANGTPVYVETQSATTNANGLVSVQLGGGTAVSGSIGAISWGSGPFFLRTETDPAGGTDYTITGSSELLSVPYALHAANNMAGPAGPQGPPGAPGCDLVRAGSMVVVYTAANAYGFYQSGASNDLNAGNWSTVSLAGTVLGAIASERTIVVYTTTNAYGFYQAESFGGSTAGNWNVVNLVGDVIDAASNQNQVVVYTSSNAYGFYQSQSNQSLNGGSWSTTSLAGTPMGAVPSRHQIVVYTTTNAYGFYQSHSFEDLNAGNWSEVNLAGTPAGALPAR